MANDHVKFSDIIRQFPQVWDRNHPHFRDKTTKEKYWIEISKMYDSSEAACKDLFKALREKYLREREKARQLGSMYVPWPLLENLQFLEPHIVLRKQSNTLETPLPAADEFLPLNSEKDTDCDYEDFDKHLIKLVKMSAPIWDRNTKSFCSKQLKQELWRNIAGKLRKNPHNCALRWKALREKYIRQKTKFLEGEGKWYLLDEMSFLDKVIQYRRKPTDSHGSHQLENDNNLQLNIFETFSKEEFVNTNSTSCTSNNDYDNSIPFNDDENSTTNSFNEIPLIVKQEETFSKEQSVNTNSTSTGSNNDCDNSTYDEEHSTTNSFNEIPVIVKQEEVSEVPDCFNNDNTKSMTVVRKRTESEMSESNRSMTIKKLDSVPDSQTLLVARKRKRSEISESNHSMKIIKLNSVPDCQTVVSKRTESEISESNHSMNIGKPETVPDSQTPEQVFGNLVALMLSKKPERDKNIAMVEIMTILTK